MFHRIIFHLLIVRSLSYSVNRGAVCSQLFLNLTCRSTQKAAHIKRFLRLQIVIKPVDEKTNKMYSFNITLKCNAINVHWNTRPQITLQIWCLVKVRTSWPVLLKAYDWSSWILTECNLSWKIVKYYILSEVFTINTHLIVLFDLRCDV